MAKLPLNLRQFCFVCKLTRFARDVIDPHRVTNLWYANSESRLQSNYISLELLASDGEIMTSACGGQ